MSFDSLSPLRPAVSRTLLIGSGAWPKEPEFNKSSESLIEVRGVRSSWLTVETNCDFTRYAAVVRACSSLRFSMVERFLRYSLRKTREQSIRKYITKITVKKCSHSSDSSGGLTTQRSLNVMIRKEIP